MQVSSIELSPNFNSKITSNDSKNQNKKKHFNPVSTTGYLALGFFGTSMITGINKNIKLHKASCYLATASAAAHVASLSIHRHNRPQNIG